MSLLSTAYELVFTMLSFLLIFSTRLLQELLTAHPASDHTTIILDDIAFEDMRSLLDFVYTGGVTVPEERLPSFLEAARSLQITVLTDRSLHQQVVTRPQERTVPPLIKVPQDRVFYQQNYRQPYKSPVYVVTQNGYKSEFKTSAEPMDYDQLKPNGLEWKPPVDSDFYKIKTEHKVLIREQDFISDSSKDSTNHGSPTVEDKPFIPSPHHLSPIPKSEPIQNKFDTSSSGSSPSHDPTDFQWVRPLPSLMPISASTVLSQRRLGVQSQKSPRRPLGGILTPSPWSQNGRPQAGAPRVVRSPSRGLERSVQNEDYDHVEGRLNSSPSHVQTVSTFSLL